MKEWSPGMGVALSGPWCPPASVARCAWACAWVRLPRELDMTHQPIISRGESLRILENDIRRRELERRAPELNNASEEQRAEIMAQIDRQVRKEVRRLAPTAAWHAVLH